MQFDVSCTSGNAVNLQRKGAFSLLVAVVRIVEVEDGFVVLELEWEGMNIRHAIVRPQLGTL